MKNLCIYLNPDGFDEEHQGLVKLQVDNSLELGWSLDDIVLVTDFPYEYRGVRAIQIPSGICCLFWKPASKIFGILHMIEQGLIGDDLYWFHDFDAYQLIDIPESELGLESIDAGFTDYGRKPEWNTGSFFFKKSAEDIFRNIASRLLPGCDSRGRQQHEELALGYLTDKNIDNINSRIKRMNITYNFGMREIAQCYERAIKPLRVLHFHPYNPKINTLKRAMYGRNQIGKPLMNDRLIKLFHIHGYR